MNIFFSFFHILFLINKIKVNSDLISSSKKSKRKLSLINNYSLNDIIYIESVNDIVSYISSYTSEDNTVYITTNTETSNSNSRIIYIIKTYENNFFYEYKNISINSAPHNKYALITILKIQNKEYIVTVSHEGQFELFDYDNENSYYCPFFKVVSQNSVISKNTFTSLKFHNNTDYILNVYVDKHDFYFLIQKFYYLGYYINSLDKIRNTQIRFEKAFKSSSVTCFEIKSLVECLYSNWEFYYTIAIFKISDLNNVYNQTIEENPIDSDSEELFSKCIYIKNNIGAFIYYISNNHFPKLKFKSLIINENSYELNDYIEPIHINSLDKYPLEYNYIYNDIIKTDNNNIFYISTTSNSTEIYIILFKLLNNDSNVLINYYKIILNEIYNIRLYKDITTFSLNGLLGIGMTNYDYDKNINKTYSSFFLIGNCSFNNGKYRQSDINIFNSENKINISEIFNINNNIFGYSIKIKILSFIDETNLGFYIYSNNQNKSINANDLINSDDIIQFKINNNTGVKLGIHFIEYLVIIKEKEELDIFNSYSDYTEYFPNNDNEDNFILYFQPKTLLEKKFFFNITINECYETCKKCSYFGNIVNHRCTICSDNYPFYIISSFTKNCFELCPDNLFPNKDKKCVTLDEINNCENLFYFDDNLNINCIYGNICIDKYPHLDEKIKTMCTNCLVTYNNKCYLECPKNTCIKQDIYLNVCIDIENNMKVINNICFDNFQDIANNIKNMSDNIIILEDIPELIVYAYNINKKEDNYIKNKLVYIYFESIKEILIDKYNLNESTNLYALLVSSPSKYSNSSINDFDFVLLLENGTVLNLSNIEDLKVNISIPITNLDLINYNYALELSEQGYDIYSKESSFYNDICTPGYINDNDIILEERKQEIYPNNVTMRKSNCIYQSTDLINQRFLYECKIFNNNISNVVDYFETEEKEENLNNYILDFINYKILNCGILFSDINNYRHNKAVIICTTCIFLSFLFFFVFLFHGLSKIRIMMNNEIPTPFKINHLIKKFKQKNKSHNYKKIKVSSSNPIKKDSCNKGKNFIKNKNNILKMDSCLTIDKIKNRKSKKCNQKLLSIKDHKKLSNLKNINLNDNNKENNNDIEYDDLPLSLALKADKRKIIKMFIIKLTEKIEIIDILANKKIKEISLSKYFLFLLLDLSMNALLYSDQIVSHKRHNNGKLDFFLSILLSSFSNILASIIGYYLQHLIGFEERINQITEIKKEFVFLRVFKIIYREIIIRVISFFIIEILTILLCSYYLFIFFTIYHKSQLSMLGNYGISLLENWLINLIITIIIVIFRKIGIHYNNRYIYNTSKYIDKNF